MIVMESFGDRKSVICFLFLLMFSVLMSMHFFLNLLFVTFCLFAF